MSEIIESTGREVTERTPEVIAAEIRYIDEETCKSILHGAIEIGQRLQEAKEMLAHGEWESWCKENLDYSKSKAERFMKIAAEYGDENSTYYIALTKTSTLTDLSISNALRLLQVPEKEVENFAEKHDLSSISARELEKEIKKLKADLKAEEDAKASAERSLEDAAKIAEKEKADLQEEIKKLKDELELAMTVEVNDEFESYKKEMSEKIEQLQEKLEKSKSKVEMLKEEINQANGSVQEAVKRAVKEATENAADEAAKKAESEVSEKLAELEAEKREKQEEIERLEKKLSASSDDTLIRLNIKVQNLQTELKDIKSLLNRLEPEMAGKIKVGIKTIFEGYKELME